MHIMSVVGARPQFVKLAPVAHAMARQRVSHTIVHTGQHYDALLSDAFFRDLEIPPPDVNLAVGSGRHGAQTGSMLQALEETFLERQPDVVLVYGDTNSTLAAALAAVKMHLPVAHLEAGLRSHNRRMPEEHNRVLTDHAADLLLTPTPAAMQSLTAEGLAHRSILVGDVMVDVLLTTLDRVRATAPSLPFDPTERTIATLHRAENTDDPRRLNALLDALAASPRPVELLAHPRLVATARSHDLALMRGAITAHDPLPYPALVSAVSRAHSVITDSGGLQKEAFVLGTACTTFRSETEWTETTIGGWNVLVDPTSSSFAADAHEALNRSAPTTVRGEPYGAGAAADQVVTSILDRFETTG